MHQVNGAITLSQFEIVNMLLRSERNIYQVIPKSQAEKDALDIVISMIGDYLEETTPDMVEYQL